MLPDLLSEHSPPIAVAVSPHQHHPWPHLSPSSFQVVPAPVPAPANAKNANAPPARRVSVGSTLGVWGLARRQGSDPKIDRQQQVSDHLPGIPFPGVRLSIRGRRMLEGFFILRKGKEAQSTQQPVKYRSETEDFSQLNVWLQVTGLPLSPISLSDLSSAQVGLDNLFPRKSLTPKMTTRLQA